MRIQVVLATALLAAASLPSSAHHGWAGQQPEPPVGTHQRLNSSGFDHASKTSRAGASNDLVTTTSRSDGRSTCVMRFVGGSSPCAFVSICLLPLFQFHHLSLHLRLFHLLFLSHLLLVLQLVSHLQL